MKAFGKINAPFFNQDYERKAIYQAWQANIAVAFQDTLGWAGYQFPELHKLSNAISRI